MQWGDVQCGLQRMVTGGRCDVAGCYETAFWLVVYGPKTAHLCTKHTRARMTKKVGRSAEGFAKDWI